MLAVFFLHDWFWEPLRGLGYQFWSGIGSDISEITLLAGLGAYLMHHNCHVHHCWRLQWKTTAAGDRVCRKHHPENTKTATQVHDDHHAARGHDA